MTQTYLEDTVLGPKAGGLYRRQNIVTGLVAGLLFGFIGWLIGQVLLQGSNWGSDMTVTTTGLG